MKRIRVEEWNIIAYIEQQDVEFLLKIKEVVPASFFEEDAVINGECDDKGFYRITDINSVNYIKTAPFILNLDRLEKSSLNDLQEANKKAIEDRNKLLGFLQRLYSKSNLTQEEIQDFNECSVVTPYVAKEILNVAYTSNNEEQERKFIILDEALRMQSEYYIQNLSEYTTTREKAEKKNKSKLLSVRRFFQPKV